MEVLKKLKNLKESEMTPASSKATVRQRVKVPIHGGSGTFVTFKGLKDSGEHVAIDFGVTLTTNPLVRIHSECLTGDVFLSGKCDCGEQLREAIEKLGKRHWAL
jgi:GTP cyclohydrolase II